MLISYNWLKKHVSIPFSAEEVAVKLKSSTVEVEKIDFLGKNLEGVVVGEIIEIKKHPDAEKLSLAQVDVGESKPRQIVFGQMVKIEIGFKVPVALAPTVLPGSKEIKKGKIRGEISEGMLCLDQELGLLKDGVSIRLFDKKIKNGTPIVEVLNLNDYILEIDNKSLSNRPDLWGHYGIAREVAVLFNRVLNEYKVEEIKNGKDFEIEVEVEDKKLCPRYMAVAVSGIKVADSPDWLKQSLLSIGIRPINNIVDITNYVMMDLGQPMHAFDKSKVKSQKSKVVGINIRKSKAGEKILALDEKEYELNEQMLVIADNEKPIALAGVIGGEDTGVNENTETIIFESANFDPTSIRKTSTKLGLRTDSAMRFEKSLDPNLCELALKKAVELTLEICPSAKVASKVVDKLNFVLPVGPIEVDLALFKNKLGVEIPEKEIVRILEKLGFGLKQKKNILSVKIPTWRATKDVSIVEDLVEEVARIYGYENIESSLPVFSINPPERNQLRYFENKIKNLLAIGFGYTEVYNYSFVSPVLLQKLGMDVEAHLELDNPLVKDRPFIRRNLLPNMLENVINNAHSETVKIFEIGKVFLAEEAGQRIMANSDELLPRQDTKLGLIFSSKFNSTPFFEISKVLSGIFIDLGLKYDFVRTDKIGSSCHAGRSAQINVEGVEIGFITELNSFVQKDLKIENRVGLAEINLDKLIGLIKNESKYAKLSSFPTVKRDVAFVVNKEIIHQNIVDEIKKISDLIVQVELFDVYDGKNIGDNKKSLAYHIVYQSSDRTLESNEVDKLQTELKKMLMNKFMAELRG